jgi:hypothetical protein
MNISGFQIPDSINLRGKTLYLNGAAMRNKFFMNIYIIALYSEKPITKEEDAIHSNIERSLRMLITTPMATPKIISENIEEGIKYSLGSLYNQLKPTVDKIKETISYAQIGYKDHIDNYYTSDGVMQMYKNDQFLSEDKDGKVFAESLFNMYMGKNPKDRRIKKELLKGF